jgi:hypothetical protein
MAGDLVAGHLRSARDEEFRDDNHMDGARVA